MPLTLVLVVVLFMTSGCASYHYSQVKKGELRGKLIVQWIDYDKFMFLPDEKAPLTFIEYDKQPITPGKMYTDGGSIPRLLWAIKSYSPWGYAPAFIVHDWLFVMHHCKLDGYERYDLEKAAWVLSEIIKTLMEDPKYGEKDVLVLYSMYEAVRSPVAEKLWREGACEQLPVENFLFMQKEPLFQYTIEFPQQPIK
jgi:hypothetical protein